ncbi:SHOCT domain-containing protein [Halorubellus salinus]|uniref:SHOCT domain-containing protein n=1 Tax=Halorubellus salinus TaxID=755309 RepID=UPI001D06C218|nr:SHOCT domain-containing protein [Halorubellus salinus]
MSDPEPGAVADDGDRDAQAVGHEILESLAGVIAVGTLGLGVTSAVVGYGGLTAPIFVVGWLLLLPLAGVLSENSAAQSFVGRLFGGARRTPETQSDDEAALEELKGRYARGEIDEAEFERRTATLLENESVEDVRDRVDREGVRATDRAARSDRERAREYET